MFFHLGSTTSPSNISDILSVQDLKQASNFLDASWSLHIREGVMFSPTIW